MSRSTRKRTIRELKEKGRRFPYLEWFMNKAYVYVIFGFVGLIALTMFSFEIVYAYQRINEDPIEQVDYIDITPQETTGEKWAAAFLAEKPEGINDWVVSDQHNARNPYTYNECSYYEIPSKNMKTTLSGTGKEASIYIQNFQPGTSAKEFKTFIKNARNCWNVEMMDAGEPETSLVKHSYGSMFNYGDSIIYLKTTNEDIRDQLTPKLMQKAVNTLTETECVNLTTNENDDQRNLYVSAENYKGWHRTDRINTNVDYTHVPTLTEINKKRIREKSLPEGPLPEGFPTLPEKKMDEPTKPNATDRINSFYKDIAYVDPDQDGPGCGWKWHGMKAPKVDVEQLQQTEKILRADALQTANNEATKYILLKNNETISMMDYLSKVLKWNEYASDIQKVYDKWEWLNDERRAIKYDWDRYVRRHDEWIDFDIRQHNARVEYERAVYECSLETHTYTPEPYPDETIMVEITPTPTPEVPEEPVYDEEGNPIPVETPIPTPTMVPSIIPGAPREPIVRNGCANPPARPYILQQSRPAEPQPPAIPEGVTIPESWNKPKTTSGMDRLPDFVPLQENTETIQPTDAPTSVPENNTDEDNMDTPIETPTEERTR